ncbi:MAG: hypothetical protein MZV64_11505 [Ignavibacteriales bacterium]|nr:hypothetical protein [Ignavibacteriales bacterium]MCK7518295.1 hypothetical protein [Ignavibacteriales bacterium]
MESRAITAVIPDPVLGVDLLHVCFSPKRVSVDYYQPKDQYYCNFKLNVTLKKGEELIFQHEKDFPFYFPPDRKEYIEANGIAIEDVFPVAEGEYDMALLLQNSVGKEFSYIEQKILIPKWQDPPCFLGTPSSVTGWRPRPATFSSPSRPLITRSPSIPATRSPGKTNSPSCSPWPGSLKAPGGTEGPGSKSKG